MCGEKFALRNMMNVNQGSSPRMRGKGGRTGSSGRYTGITPACAGKSAGECQRPPCPQDHPRVCGEKLLHCCFLGPASGSPLRMRGKETPLASDELIAGITPACAGKRPCGSSSHRLCRDHPRVCREKLRIVEVGRVKEGSPPRVRGKEQSTTGVRRSAGITPACAGKSGTPTWATAATGDHPRVCGEKFLL